LARFNANRAAVEVKPWPVATLPDQGYFIALVGSYAAGRGRADARLIAAAPDLLAALEQAIDCVDWLGQVQAGAGRSAT
jgi:hypothetical protein